MQQELNDLQDRLIIQKYKDFCHDLVSYNFPNLAWKEIDDAIMYSIMKRFKNTSIELVNSYKNQKMDSTVADLLDYVLKCEPIITPSGVMFKKHDQEINPINDMIQKFLKLRGIHKDEMFKYKKGEEKYNQFNLLQLLDKCDANSKLIGAN